MPVLMPTRRRTVPLRGGGRGGRGRRAARPPADSAAAPAGRIPRMDLATAGAGARAGSAAGVYAVLGRAGGGDGSPGGHCGAAAPGGQWCADELVAQRITLADLTYHAAVVACAMQLKSRSDKVKAQHGILANSIELHMLHAPCGWSAAAVTIDSDRPYAAVCVLRNLV